MITSNYFDPNLNNENEMFYKTMDSFYSQRKQLEDFNRETQYNINDINSYYWREEDNFKRKFNQKKKK